MERDANGLPYSENAGISTHTLTWSVTRRRYIQHWGSKFQLTRSRGAWQYNKKCIDEINNFNSHAHVERDFISAYLSFCHTISTHTLTWSVTLKNSNLQTVTTFQLTRSRGAWLPVFDYSIENIHISTHTLTWSVTSVLQQLEISLHFNSHAHVERDRRNALHLTSWILFQLTRSRGAWPSFVSIVFHVLKFQLTRSRGAWRYWKMLPVLTLHFNSHAHVERDQFVF